MGGKDEAVGVDEGNRELTTQLSRFSFHVPAHSCNVLVLVNEEQCRIFFVNICIFDTAEILV